MYPKSFICLIFSVVIYNSFIAQLDCNPSFNLDCADSIMNKKKIFLLGEYHDRDVETSYHQIKLVKKLIERGERKIKIIVEASPIIGYKMSQYLKGEDSILNNNTIFNVNYKLFLDSLKKYTDIIDIEIVGVDINELHYFKITKSSFYDLNPDSEYFKRLVKETSKKKFIRLIKSMIQDSTLINEIKANNSKAAFSAFINEVEGLSQFGFYSLAKSRRKIEVRDNLMAKRLDVYYDEGCCMIFSIGAQHIKPKIGKDYPDLVRFLNKYERDDLCIMPILYEIIDYKIIYRISIFKTLFVKDQDEMKRLFLDTGIFDIVLAPAAPPLPRE